MPDNPSLNKRVLIVGALGVVLGFLAGFFLANGINREEQEKLRAELATTRAGRETAQQQGSGAGKTQPTSAPGGDSSPSLSEEQIVNAIKRADQSPQDPEMQKKVGQGIFLYASETGNASYLPDGARILKRAHELDPKDYKTTVMAGDAQFLAERQGGGDAKLIAEARKLYEAALVLKPDDAVVRTKLGLTYFYDSPPNPQRAVNEYRRALQADPRQEMSLQSLAAALVETGALDEAARRLDELEKLNPSNAELPGLRTQLEQKRNAAKEKP
ncbi:MAG: tetratricopeptide repeat protein [Acidobacteria bacterium]|nr:tetratricopeptide repeat protein [Acidobacteriota bacterium]